MGCICLVSAFFCGSWLSTDFGVSFIENGMNLFIWVGEMVKHDWLQLVFGVSMFAQLDPEKIVQLCNKAILPILLYCCL